jgi:membrane protein implicated in regulation of membrane protease activity
MYMEVESRSLQQQHRGYSNLDRLEVIQHSNCLLVFCVIIAFVAFMVCLGIYMATHGTMAGIWLYIFLIFLAAGLICLSVVGWQFYLIKREKDDEHRLAHAEIRLLNKTTTLVDDAIKHRDHVDLRRDDEKGVTDVKIIRAGVPMPGRAGVQRISEQQQQAINPPAPAEEVKEEPIAIPTAPKFWDIVPLIENNRMPLCFIVDVNPNSPTYGQTVPAFGTILDLLSLCIIGRPGRGKSVLLLYYICCLAKHGAEMHVLDPQGAFKELQLLHDKPLPAMPPTARIYYYSSLQEMEFAVDNVLNDIKEREALFQPRLENGKLKVHTLKHPLVVLADELPIIAEMDVENRQRVKEENRARKEEGLELLKIRQVTSMVKTAVLAARKYHVYFIGASQSIDAGILPTRITSSFNSRIVFSTTEQKARQIGLEGADAKRFLPVIRRAGPGQTIYDCGRWDQPAVGAFPNMSIEDVLQFFGISMDELERLWIAELTAREQQQQQQPTRNTGPLAGDTPPAIVQKKKRATYADAILVWNEFAAKGWEIGRPKLRQELQAKGLECSDDLAKNLLNTIKQRLESGGSSGGAGGTQ